MLSRINIGLVRTIASLGSRREHIPLLEALQDKIADNINQTELLEICLRWSYEYALGEMSYMPLPMRPPYVDKFFTMKYSTRMKQYGEDGVLRTKLQSYFGNESKIKAHNKSNEEWLDRMYKYFMAKKEEDKCEKIRGLLSEYR